MSETTHPDLVEKINDLQNKLNYSDGSITALSYVLMLTLKQIRRNNSDNFTDVYKTLEGLSARSMIHDSAKPFDSDTLSGYDAMVAYFVNEMPYQL